MTGAPQMIAPSRGRYQRAAAAFVTAMVTSAAYAHPGHAVDATGLHAFLDGLLHAFSGADHLLLVIAMGMLVARDRTRAGVLAASLFVGGVAVGVAGFLTLTAGQSAAISLGVLALGGLVLAAQYRIPSRALLAGCLMAGWLHGAAHVVDAPVAHRAGLVVCTAGLHLVGISLGLWADRAPRWMQSAIGGGWIAAAAFLAAS